MFIKDRQVCHKTVLETDSRPFPPLFFEQLSLRRIGNIKR